MRIDNKYIESKFNIDDERTHVTYNNYIGEIDIVFSGEKSVQKFKEHIDEK